MPITRTAKAVNGHLRREPTILPPSWQHRHCELILKSIDIGLMGRYRSHQMLTFPRRSASLSKIKLPDRSPPPPLGERSFFEHSPPIWIAAALAFLLEV